MATVVNIFADQGGDYSAIVSVVGSNGQPIDLTNYSVEAQIRKFHGSSSSHCFNASVIDASAGKVRLRLPASESQLMLPGRWLYDVRIISPANVKRRVIEGILQLTPQITTGPCP